LNRDSRALVLPVLRLAEEHGGGADAQLVTVAQPTPADHAIAVHERAVARQPLVDDEPVASQAGQLDMQARDLLVPGQRRVARRVAADHGRRLPQQHDPLSGGGLPVDEVGRAGPIGFEPLRQLSRRGQVQRAGIGHAAKYRGRRGREPGRRDGPTSSGPQSSR
jgi:hypothetical protein